MSDVPPLTSDETLAMIDRMAELADATAEDEPWDETYWEGWAEGLRALAQHIRTGVKVTCFPVGTCTCHPWPGKEYVLTAKPRRRRKPALHNRPYRAWRKSPPPWRGALVSGLARWGDGAGLGCGLGGLPLNADGKRPFTGRY